ncbi:MAG: hypothetical protein HYW56_02590, partial [Candidatus Harrisonbacteria bacterium]|nr:hypothetical protein [Candidatus Harrisonbacteria bacterium]
FLAWFLALMLIGAGAYFGVRYYRYRNGYLLPMERYNAYMDLFRNDTYGGATPEETLKLFVAALRAGDVEKASLYFMPDDRGSREKWVTYLSEVKAKNLLKTMADDIVSLAKPVPSDDSSTYRYEILNSEGAVGVAIDFVNNGKVWKIESL